MKLNYKRTFLVGFAFLSISAFWQMYDTIIPLIMRDTYHLGDGAAGIIMSLDNIVALFLLPLFGALSDKVGRRIPFIVAGTFTAVVLMMLIPTLDNSYGAWAPSTSLIVFVVVLGLLSWTYLLGVLCRYSVELAAVLHDRRWPRSLSGRRLTDADLAAFEALTEREIRVQGTVVTVDVPRDPT